MLAGAGVLLVMAGLSGYGSFRQWQAASALDTFADEAFMGNVERARSAGTAAKAALPHDARAALPGINPSDEASQAQLERLTRSVEPGQRKAVATALGFSQIVRGDEPTGLSQLNGTNAALLAHVQTLRGLAPGMRLPALPAAESYEPPALSILRYVFEERVATAFTSGNREDFLSAVTGLHMLDPRHPVKQELLFYKAALDLSNKPDHLIHHHQAIAAERKVPATRNAIHLLQTDRAPEQEEIVTARIAMLVDLIPSKTRSTSELAIWISRGNKKPETLASIARGDGSRPVVVTAINHLLKHEAYAEIRDLATVLAPTERNAVLLAVAERTWDTETLRALSTDNNYLPIIHSLNLGRDVIAFHMTTRSGSLAEVPVKVHVNNREVPPDAITRLGSLISVPRPEPGSPVKVHITVDGQEIFNRTLTP